MIPTLDAISSKMRCDDMPSSRSSLLSSSLVIMLLQTTDPKEVSSVDFSILSLRSWRQLTVSLLNSIQSKGERRHHATIDYRLRDGGGAEYPLDAGLDHLPHDDGLGGGSSLGGHLDPPLGPLPEELLAEGDVPARLAALSDTNPLHTVPI